MVDGDRDAVGLIAYGLYKSTKNDKCQTWKAQSLSDAEIAKRARQYHDQVVTGTSEVQRYRKMASQFLDDFSRNRESEQTAALRKQVEQLKRERDEIEERVRKTAVEEFTKKVVDTHRESLSRWSRAVQWLASGFPGALASLVLGAVGFLGAFYFSQTDVDRARVSASAINQLVGKPLVQPLPTLDEVTQQTPGETKKGRD